LSTGEAPALPPADRYGSARREPRRWRRWAWTALAVVVGFVVAYVAYVNISATSIDAERVGFDSLPGNAMKVTIDVTRDRPADRAVCIVRLRDSGGGESGRKEVLVPPGPTVTTVSTVVRSFDRPVTADVFGCSYDVPRYLSSS
jgi:hypothetical protein